jgi:hypothetical protein
MYNEFSTANIQIDKDFSAKLSGYGCVGHILEMEISNNSVVSSFTLLSDDLPFPTQLILFLLASKSNSVRNNMCSCHMSSFVLYKSSLLHDLPVSMG